MSNNEMLIDATHPEETRVVVLRGGRVEEFDFESAARKLLRGNIYLAKVTRVEPSLQAAFVEYGGNRHGFLAFNEIHPDYYQIPMADRQALLDEEAAAEAEEEAAVDAEAEELARRRQAAPANEDLQETFEETIGDPIEEGDNGSLSHEGQNLDDQPRIMVEATLPEDDTIAATSDIPPEPSTSAANENSQTAEIIEAADASGNYNSTADARDGETVLQDVDTNSNAEPERVEQVASGEDALEDLPSRPRRRQRSYKIQEVIKRRQVILIQVVKEERGNKGAALTTYLSLAGRYTVLMPNTARGGGISRKITNPQDRKRLKSIAADLEVPDGMGLIIRTAGAARTKQEIRRDFEYLLRLWESVRDLTLQSQAPNLVYEEGNLIKRSIRDLYNKDVNEIIVAGGHAHREAKDFMRMLMPSHAKNVILYQEPEPLFTRFQIERQLNAMFSPYVTQRSGGYLVINQTEALVAIDVNSGKATREFSIEETALKTNLEAADEMARQLKLRDLAGLIVIDFIDMEERRNNRSVERRLKESLRFDRARIQVGRISHFGLLEMSRQRLRTGVLEGSTSQCAHCQGTGIIRSTESVALAVLRGLEDAIMAGTRTPLIAMTVPSVALYILNNKRAFINDMEARHGLPITVTGSDKLAGANFVIEKGTTPSQIQPRSDRGTAVNMDWGFEGEGGGQIDGEESTEAREDPRASATDAEGTPRRRRRRRRRGSRQGDQSENELMSDEQLADDAGKDEASEDEAAPSIADAEGHSRSESEEERDAPRSRRRGRRGGRRVRQAKAGAEGSRPDPTGEQPDIDASVFNAAPNDEGPFGEQPVDAENEVPPKSAPREPTAPPEPPPPPTDNENGADQSGLVIQPAEPQQENEPKRATRKRARRPAGAGEPRIERVVVGPAQESEDDPAVETQNEETARPTRKGWWQRRLGGE
jgi:ribonuclease E